MVYRSLWERSYARSKSTRLVVGVDIRIRITGDSGSNTIRPLQKNKHTVTSFSICAFFGMDAEW